ncbi:hypothetical protein [Myxococcus xanthus]|uniref:hypothetical protein n=3 Tax=Myxococcus TaxID=32 RepID=UPI000899B61E|nr:hypothetical protein [Myxococcus xanthus]QPM77051.1 hypothetical protein I5Q59_22135 [Myxococcus xanthus]QVW66119.1 hypothetical protein JTM82_27490 [Myxococcus xanthus DZ2]QZZ52155.1 hypothetical protein MyxoNM_23375 [Myxococcus xanthus]UEO07753.1 hypothetical protein K1515_15305 [Myxococcus xanthus DZ2]UYI19259.1 hypothetical protein N1129_23160 [Myxococcus xanthus]
MTKPDPEKIELKYQPPHDWEARLTKLAKDADLNIFNIYHIGDAITYRIRPLLPLPGVPASPPEKRIQAFRDAAQKMLEDPALSREKPRPPSNLLHDPPLIYVGVAFLLIAIAVFASSLANKTPLPATLLTTALAASALFSFNIRSAIAAAAPSTTTALQETLRRQEELFNRLSYAHTEKETNSGLAKATLIIRANSAKEDQDKLWRRSNIAFYVGCTLFIISLTGPAVTYWMIAKGILTDWRQYLPGISASIIMVTAAATLLRYDGKLRDHFQAKSDEVAYFNRLQLAIDSAHALSEKAYRNTLRRVIRQLISPPSSLVKTALPPPPANDASSREILDGTISDLVSAINRISKTPSTPDTDRPQKTAHNSTTADIS